MDKCSSTGKKRNWLRLMLLAIVLLLMLAGAAPALAWEPARVEPGRVDPYYHRHVYAYKFHDKNGDGSKNGTDSWLADWTMKLYNWNS
ncbi:MAG: hypothetical protein ABIK79_05180, partial [Chloroflexota bacterium]